MNVNPLLRALETALRKTPGSTAKELAARLGLEIATVKRLLYANQDRFEKFDLEPPAWGLRRESVEPAAIPRSLTTREEWLLDNYVVETLYSIQAIDNLESIQRYGIVSRNKRRALGITGVDLSKLKMQAGRAGRTIDARSLHDYVPLYFRPFTPMLYELCMTRKARDRIALLEIDVAVLGIPGVRFTDGNAKTGKTYMHLSELSHLDWDVLNSLDRWSLDSSREVHFQEYKHRKSAEALIPDVVPSKCLLTAYVTSGCRSSFDLAFPVFADDSLFPQGA